MSYDEYSDIQCPYCGENLDIDHDDGYGYEQDEKHEQQCEYCEKLFVYQTSITFYYDAEKADCLNDGKHDWVEMNGAPREYFENKRRCSVCDERKTLD